MKTQFPKLSVVLAFAASLFVFSVPAHAYEEDTHFQMTYVVCRSVGFTHDEALIVAAADQGMDDSPGLVANGGVGGIIPNIPEEWMWHALDLNGNMHASGVLARRDLLFQTALNEPGYYNKLVRLGVFFHFQQDTWAHRHHYVDYALRVGTSYDPNHLSRTNYTTYDTPFGHAKDGHAPDRPPFDPVAALMNLEDDVVYARTFLQQALGRTPGTYLVSYQPQGGQQDNGWNGSNKGTYFNQISLAGAAANSSRSYLLNLIRAQINIYDTSISPNPRISPYYTPDEANLGKNKATLDQVAKNFEPYRSVGLANPTINIPTTAQKAAAGFTNLSSPFYNAKYLPLASAITDGMRIVLQSNGAVYLAIDGKLRWIPNQPTYNNLIVGAVTAVPVNSITQYPVGPPITNGAYLAAVSGQPAIYLVVDGTKRWINSPAALNRYGFNGPVRQLTTAQMAAIPDGPQIGNPPYTFIGKDGALVQTANDGKVYLVINEQLRWVPNPATFNNLFISNASIASVPDANGYLVGPQLTDGAYLAQAAGNPKVYLIVDGTKRWVTSPEAMNAFSFNAAKIRGLTAAQLAAIPDGPNVP